MKELKHLKIFFRMLAVATLFFGGAVVGTNFVQYKESFWFAFIVFVFCMLSAIITTFLILCEKKNKKKEEKKNPGEETGDVYFSNKS